MESLKSENNFTDLTCLSSYTSVICSSVGMIHYPARFREDMSGLRGAYMPKSSSKKTERPVEELSYEEALVELENIVSALEDGQSQLEEAIKLFERGQALAARCGVLLEAAELKVKQVVGEDAEAVVFEE
jgi:exodeoxyribonuclease VII small subunit